ncbi:MAG TPA: elongation factor P maturation arginine rhamnosyltransferase EarP, partial [Rectinemataceae bacterium]|nr:elongation factor P maturation arginine rhamnosyltransferase EarP [Rectinemataceae bacterium]
MNASRTTIDLLCKVVDNFGDIGVVFRLARALHSVAPALRLRLVVDDLHAFSRVCPGIDPSLDIQSFSDWTVLRWSIPWHGLASAPPDVLVESFACGRPEWYERALSSIEAPRPRLIIDLEHLTAESYAEDMHLLDSLTALPLASKCLFFPGFSAKTGGLILDPSFMEARKLYADPVKRQSARQHLALRLGIGPTGSAAQRFW